MRISRKLRTVGLLALGLILLLPAAVRAKEQRPEDSVPATHAQAASLIDVTSGRILYSSHGDDELPIASLTKIMTAIVAIEHGKPGSTVKVSRKAYGKEGSSIYLHLGEEMTLENMLYGLMLRSGNDAATAIAEHVGGSEEGFVYLMNEKVKMLGLEHTQFQNPHGLDAKGHYSSANDLAKLTAYALHNPLFKEIVRTPSKKAPNPYDPWDYRWDNKNKMLRLYEGADGVKTGYTKVAKRCLVSSATRNGQQLVAVTINDGDDWNDHRKLLDYGFAQFPLTSLIKEGQPLDNGMIAGAGFSYPLASEEAGKVEMRLSIKGARNDAFGYRGDIRIALGKTEIGSVPVYDRRKGKKDSIQPSSAVNVVAENHQPQGPGAWPSSLGTALRSLLLSG